MEVALGAKQLQASHQRLHYRQGPVPRLARLYLVQTYLGAQDGRLPLLRVACRPLQVYQRARLEGRDLIRPLAGHLPSRSSLEA